MLRPLPVGLRCGGRRAAAAVEFAIVSLFFFSFVLALIELGRGLMVHYVLINAARQGCRNGLPPGRTTAEITTAANQALTDSRIHGATVTVLINGTAGEASTAVTGDRITVIVQVPVSQITWVPLTRFLRSSLSGQYTLRRE